MNSDKLDNKLSDSKETISGLRHDLKTPLTAIQGYVELIISKLENDSKEKRWAEEALKDVKRLYKMIDERLR